MQPGDAAHLVQRRARQEHPDCLEYVVVHEMIHYLERGHGERFTKLMDRELPDWRRRREQLNREPLAEEAWGTVAREKWQGLGNQFVCCGHGGIELDRRQSIEAVLPAAPRIGRLDPRDDRDTAVSRVAPGSGVEDVLL